jgi:hypothetical protein
MGRSDEQRLSQESGDLPGAWNGDLYGEVSNVTLLHTSPGSSSFASEEQAIET